MQEQQTKAAARAANVAEEVIKAESAEEDATAEVATAVEATVEEAVKVVDQSRRAGIAVKAAEKIKAAVSLASTLIVIGQTSLEFQELK